MKSIRKRMEERELKEISLTDPDARLMKTRHGMDVCYNAQVSVDGKNHLIAEYDLRNDQNDKGSLLPTSRITGDFLHSTDMEVVADKGYFSFDNVRDMWLDGFDAYIPEEKFGNKRKRGKEPFSPFDQSNFVYDSSNDTQTSPAGATLHRSRENIKTHNNMNWIYSIGTLTCCHLHSKAASGYRRIVRWEYQEDLDKHRRKMSIILIPSPAGNIMPVEVLSILDTIREVVPNIDLVLFDRGFYSKDLIMRLSNLPIPYIIFVPKREMERKELESMQFGEKKIVIYEFSFYSENKKIRGDTKLAFLRKILDKRTWEYLDWIFATNLEEINLDSIISQYKIR